MTFLKTELVWTSWINIAFMYSHFLTFEFCNNSANTQLLTPTPPQILILAYEVAQPKDHDAVSSCFCT